MPIGNQPMCARVGNYNFSRKVLKAKSFISKENKFYTAHSLSKIILFTCLAIYIFDKLLFLHAVSAYIGGM